MITLAEFLKRFPGRVDQTTEEELSLFFETVRFNRRRFVRSHFRAVTYFARGYYALFVSSGWRIVELLYDLI